MLPALHSCAAVGFVHLGRFAGAYREHFGENPSVNAGACSAVAAARQVLLGVSHMAEPRRGVHRIWLRSGSSSLGALLPSATILFVGQDHATEM